MYICMHDSYLSSTGKFLAFPWDMCFPARVFSTKSVCAPTRAATFMPLQKQGAQIPGMRTGNALLWQKIQDLRSITNLYYILCDTELAKNLKSIQSVLRSMLRMFAVIHCILFDTFLIDFKSTLISEFLIFYPKIFFKLYKKETFNQY